MQRSILAVLGAIVLIGGAAIYGQTHADTPVAPGTTEAAGVASVTLKPAP